MKTKYKLTEEFLTAIRQVVQNGKTPSDGYGRELADTVFNDGDLINDITKAAYRFQCEVREDTEKLPIAKFPIYVQLLERHILKPESAKDEYFIALSKAFANNLTSAIEKTAMAFAIRQKPIVEPC